MQERPITYVIEPLRIMAEKTRSIMSVSRYLIVPKLTPNNYVPIYMSQPLSYLLSNFDIHLGYLIVGDSIHIMIEHRETLNTFGFKELLVKGMYQIRNFHFHKMLREKFDPTREEPFILEVKQINSRMNEQYGGIYHSFFLSYEHPEALLPTIELFDEMTSDPLVEPTIKIKIEKDGSHTMDADGYIYEGHAQATTEPADVPHRARWIHPDVDDTDQQERDLAARDLEDEMRGAEEAREHEIEHGSFGSPEDYPF